MFAHKVKAKDILFAGDDINEFGYFPKSKLSEIWNKANEQTLEQPLVQEAKKYKSAEEFVKAQQPLYHGTDATFEKLDIEMAGEVQVSDWGQGVYFTDNPVHAKSFAEVAGGDIVMERFAPSVKFADGQALLKDRDFMDALDDDMGFITPGEYLKEKGFDGVK